jgi:hypothetical protein
VPDAEAERLAEFLLKAASASQTADGEICFYDVEESRTPGEDQKEKRIRPKGALLRTPGDEPAIRRTAC